MRVQARALAVVLACMLALVAARSAAAEYPTLDDDGVPWSFDPAARIVAIGDLHGNYDRLIDILLYERLIDVHGNWIGGDAHLVVAGDINGKGRQTRLIIETLMRLEREAHRHGGYVHTLLGNHDLKVLWGDLTSTSKAEARGFADYDEVVPANRTLGLGDIPRAKRGFLAALTGDTDIAAWLRMRNMVVRIGDNFYGHGGVRRWVETVDLGRYNATARAFIAYFQGLRPKPKRRFDWVVFSDLSSAWDRKLLNEDLSLKKVTKIKRALGVLRLFFGHRPSRARSESGQPQIGEIYPGVYLLDTEMGNVKHGAAAAAVVTGETVRLDQDIPVSGLAAALGAAEMQRVSLCGQLDHRLVIEGS